MDYAVLQGTVPVATMQDYSSEVHAYTRGLGHLTLELSGYDVCHNSEEVIAETGYDSEADTANPTGSVFCAHGAGFIVPWDQVDDYMHLPRQFVPEEETQTPADGRSYETDGQSFWSGAPAAVFRQDRLGTGSGAAADLCPRVWHEPRGYGRSGAAQVAEKRNPTRRSRMW